MRTNPSAIRNGFSLIDLQVLLGLLALLLGVALPAIRRSREAADQRHCQNNLKQLGAALHDYASTHQHLPPRGTARPPRHGWVSLLLPHLGLDDLAKRYSFEHDWNDRANAEAIKTQLPLLHCPSAPNPNRLASGTTPAQGQQWTGSCSDYVVSSSVDGSARRLGLPPAMDLTGAFTTDTPRRLTDFVDGTANTLMLVEQAGRPEIWRRGARTGDRAPSQNGAGAYNVSNQTEQHGHSPDGRTYPGPCAINCSNFRGIYAFHPGFANVCFVDGSVRSLREGMNIFVLLALTTKNGGEIVGSDDF